MEFGPSSLVPCGNNIVGLSWTSQSAESEANLLLTTTESRVEVHAPDDRHATASWLTRPGSYNRFTVAAVQSCASRRLYCVQDHTRLFSWHEKDASQQFTPLKLGEILSTR